MSRRRAGVRLYVDYSVRFQRAFFIIFSLADCVMPAAFLSPFLPMRLARCGRPAQGLTYYLLANPNGLLISVYEPLIRNLHSSYIQEKVECA